MLLKNKIKKIISLNIFITYKRQFFVFISDGSVKYYVMMWTQRNRKISHHPELPFTRLRLNSGMIN